MNCRKCGAELHPEQKVCLQCGTRTAAGGNFAVDEKESWRPTPNMIKAGIGVLVLIVLLLVMRGLRTIPPDQIAQEWFDSMVGRNYGKAQKYITEGFKSRMVTGVSDLRALSDNYYEEVINNQAKYTFDKPVYDIPADPHTAKINLNLSYPDGQTKQIEIDMVKNGRHWIVDSCSN